jgi:SAM-dependent methyltransferase
MGGVGSRRSRPAYSCPRKETEVSRHIRLGEFLVGVEGVALMRGMFDRDDAAATARIEEIRHIVCDRGGAYDTTIDVEILDARSGYARWSESHDEPKRPLSVEQSLISVEEPEVWAIFEGLPPGDALDAACRTGRHARRLVELGHRVVGVDSSPEMVDKAAAVVPDAEFRRGELTSLPLESSSVDIAVCALALEHVAALDQAVEELARVVRPGGRVVLSDLHPIPRALGAATCFHYPRGGAGVVRSYRHLHGDYLRAFERAGLAVDQCLEPTFGPAEVLMQEPAATRIPDATDEAFLGLPAALVWDLARA